MKDRFEKLTTGVSLIYKKIQKIKKLEMSSFGLKGTHVMCIYYLNSFEDGLTASDLCIKCTEDKAAISRILTELEQIGFIRYDDAGTGRRYRAKAVLTEEGRSYASKISNIILKATKESGTGITEAEREIFYRVLSTISNNLDNIYSEITEKYNV